MALGLRVLSGKTRMETPGASRSKISTKPGISSAAVASAMANTKVASACAGSNSPGLRLCSNCAKAVRTCGHKASARGVGVRPWPSRRIKSSPKRSRKRRMALLTAGWVRANLCAARVRLRSAITSSKMRSRFKSRVRKLT